MNDIMISERSFGIDSLDSFFILRVIECVRFYYYGNDMKWSRHHRVLGMTNLFNMVNQFINRGDGDIIVAELMGKVCDRMLYLYGYPEDETMRLIVILFGDRGFISFLL